MEKFTEEKYDHNDVWSQYKSNKNDSLIWQQYLLVVSTIKDIMDEFVTAQSAANTAGKIDFKKLSDFVQIEDQDPFLIVLLTTELTRVLIDMHSVDFYDTAKIVSGVVTYNPRKDREDHYPQYADIKFL